MELLRRRVVSLVVCVLVVIFHVVSAEYTTAEIVDLSIPYKSNDTVTWPAFPYQFESGILKFIENPDGFNVTAYGLKMPIHSGTHIDAPCHITSVPNNLRLNEVPISRFFGPAAVIDISAKADENSGYSLTMDDVNAWEQEHGRLPDGAFVLVLTGWSKKSADDPDNYFGGKNEAGEYIWGFPGVASGVGKFLVEERNINGLGIDTASPDSGQAVGKFPVHLEILDKQRLIIENIGSNLGKLPPRGYRIHAVPLALHDTCGSPIRLLAFKEPEARAGGAVSCMYITAAMLTAFMLISTLIVGV